MSSPVEVIEDEGWDVDVLKAVRVFFDKKTNKPLLKYLTSWVGFDDFSDEWTAEHDFNDEGQVTTFHDIMPLSFDKTRIGNIWHAPQDWIDKERHMYYTENPQAYTKINSPKFVLEKRRIDRTERLEAKLEGREPFTLSANQKQIITDEAEYKKYLRKLQKQDKKAPKLNPGESQKGRAQFSGRNSIKAAALVTRTPTEMLSTAKRSFNSSDVGPNHSAPVQHRKKDAIIVGLRYKAKPISQLMGLYSNDAGDRSRARSIIGTGKSTPSTHSVTSHRVHSKPKTAPDKHPFGRESPAQGSPPSSQDSLFDASSSTESDSSDDSIPLARQAARFKSSSITQRTKIAASGDPNSELPVRTPVAPNQKRWIQTSGASKEIGIPKAQVPASTSTTAISSQRTVRPTGTTTVPPNSKSQSRTDKIAVTPIASKDEAWKDLGKPMHLGTRHVIPEPMKNAPPAPQPNSNAETSSVPLSPVSHDILPPSPLFYRDDDMVTEEPMDIDIIEPVPDAAGFIENAIEGISLPEVPEPKTNWSPVELVLQSTNSDADLCKVVLQKVTPQPTLPSLKWIHKNGFKIRTFRLQTQLSLLLLGYEPWQHAQVAAYEAEDAKLITALTSYLSETNKFALADTSLDGAKLCFYPSHSSVLANSLGIPAQSELRHNPMRLLVTVIKPASHSKSLEITRLPRYRNSAHTNPLNLISCHAIERGVRALRFPSEIKVALQQRYPGDLAKRNFVLATVESFGFRHTAKIDEILPQEHAKYGVVHQEETLALIHTLNEIGYSAQRATEYASVVFIHNAAWDTLKHLLGLHPRKVTAKTWFFAYGPFHALDSRLWGVREVFKRGGVLTFTASSIMENASQLPRLLQCIEDSAIWMAFVSPLVIGWLQAILVHDPDHQDAILGLLNLLEAVKKGQISITTAPPHPWKIDEWSEWLKSGSSICMPENLITEPGETEDAILDAAEKILHDTIGRKTTGQERIIDEAIFADLRQMMFIPVLHTEYRRFIVLRASYDREVPHIKDSIEHSTLKSLVESDKVTFAWPRSSASSIPQPTPSSATSVHGHFMSPIAG